MTKHTLDKYGLGPTALVRIPGRSGKPRGSDYHRPLHPTHPAIVNATPRYARKTRVATEDRIVLKSGHNNSKIGKRIIKGAWNDFPIYTLSLAERTTCPRSCREWLTCYGNNMPYADRFAPGPELVARLEQELSEHQRNHPKGFVVRLHVLGDFYDAEYARQWGLWFVKFPALHVFGYTAWPVESEVGQELWWLRKRIGFDRFALRFSNGRPEDGPRTRTVNKGLSLIPDEPYDVVQPGEIVCPAQKGTTLCCGTCTLCWAAPDKTVIFERH